MCEEKERWVTVSQAARHFRVSRNTVYEACREKELVCMRVRSLFRVRVDTEEEYLTVAEAAKFLDISTSTIYEACARGCIHGSIPHIRIRSRIRIPRSQLIGSDNSPDNQAEALPMDEIPIIEAMGLTPFTQNNSFQVMNALM